MSDNMTKSAKEYMNADFVYEDYKNMAEAQKIADVGCDSNFGTIN